MKPDEFWRLTYAEFAAMVEGYGREQVRRRNEMLYHAWHVENFSRYKQLPDLKTLLQDPTEKRHQQTDEEMMAVCRMLNAAFGGEFVED